MSTTLQVVGIGSTRIEHMTIVDRHPEADARVELAGYSPQWGGTVATALSTLGRLGIVSRLVSKIGDDQFGRFVLDGCAGLGIDTSEVVLQAERITPAHFVMVHRGSERRTVLMTPGNVTPLETGEIDLAAAVHGAKVVVVDGLYAPLQLEAAERARAVGAHVVLSASVLSEGMGELMALADTLIASERFASEIAPRGELEDSLLEISKLGPGTVVVKLGAEGSIGIQGDKLVRQPPLEVDVFDTTGAGDVFLGGYLFGLVLGEPLERCIQLASAAAGLSCRELGSIGGLPTLDELKEVS